MKPFLYSLILLLFLNFSSAPSQTKNVTMTIEGIRSTKGNIVVGVYTNQDNFANEKEFKQLIYNKQTLKDGKLVISFYLPAGTYGISYLDDENKNKKMEYSFWGIPEEGFGFSNYYHSSLSYPKFDSFKFTIKGNEKIFVKSRVRYM